MWTYSDAPATVLLTRAIPKGNPTEQAPVLVIPDNPAARAAMVERVMKTDGFDFHHPDREWVEYVLATALTPSQ